MDTVARDLLGIMVKFLKGNCLFKFRKLGKDQHDAVTAYMKSQEYAYNLFVHYYSSLSPTESVNYHKIGNIIGNEYYRICMKTESRERLSELLWIVYSRSTPKNYWLIPNEIGQINPRFDSLGDDKMCGIFNSAKLKHSHPDENMRKIYSVIYYCCHTLDPPLASRRVVFMRFVKKIITDYGTRENLIFILFCTSSIMFHEKIHPFIHNTDTGDSLMNLIDGLFGNDFWFLRNDFSH
jgi:hypothetical protein